MHQSSYVSLKKFTDECSHLAAYPAPDSHSPFPRLRLEKKWAKNLTKSVVLNKGIPDKPHTLTYLLNLYNSCYSILIS